MAIYKFDRDIALSTKRDSLQVFDGAYEYNTYTVYNWFSTAPGQLCIKVEGIQKGDMFIVDRENRKPYSKANVNVSIQQVGPDTSFNLG